MADATLMTAAVKVGVQSTVEADIKKETDGASNEIRRLRSIFQRELQLAASPMEILQQKLVDLQAAEKAGIGTAEQHAKTRQRLAQAIANQNDAMRPGGMRINVFQMQQASYAAQDFTQVLNQGLGPALRAANNNMSLVTFGLKGTHASLMQLGIAFGVLGLAALFDKLGAKGKKSGDDIKDAYDKVRDTIKKVTEEVERMRAAIEKKFEIQGMAGQAGKQLANAALKEREEAKKQEELAKAEEKGRLDFLEKHATPAMKLGGRESMSKRLALIDKEREQGIVPQQRVSAANQMAFRIAESKGLAGKQRDEFIKKFVDDLDAMSKKIRDAKAAVELHTKAEKKLTDMAEEKLQVEHQQKRATEQAKADERRQKDQDKQDKEEQKRADKEGADIGREINRLFRGFNKDNRDNERAKARDEADDKRKRKERIADAEKREKELDEQKKKSEKMGRDILKDIDPTKAKGLDILDEYQRRRSQIAADPMISDHERGQRLRDAGTAAKSALDRMRVKDKGDPDAGKMRTFSGMADFTKFLQQNINAPDKDKAAKDTAKNTGETVNKLQEMLNKLNAAPVQIIGGGNGNIA